MNVTKWAARDNVKAVQELNEDSCGVVMKYWPNRPDTNFPWDYDYTKTQACFNKFLTIQIHLQDYV